MFSIGIYLLGLAVMGTAALWTWMLSVLRRNVAIVDSLRSGVTLLEKDIGERRPQYADYTRRTNAFFPGVAKHR